MNTAMMKKNKGHVRFIDNLSEVVHVFLPEDKKELFEKTLEGGFFEDLIQRSFSVGKEINKIRWLINHKVNSTQLKLIFKLA